jgi:G:T-mismatch repair DNA endonuclease (very short patch repair protein)
VTRDVEHLKALKKGRWKALIIWECETAAENIGQLAKRIQRFLS